MKAVSGIAHPENYNRLILVGRNRPMQTLKKLMNARGLYARCPNPACAESFPVPQAHLFDATKPLPDFAREHLAAQRTQIAEERQRLRAERAEVKRRSFTSAASSGVGQTLEMMAASLPGLPVAPQDCRVLLKPLDYVAFSGASTGRVHSIRLIEVKSGQGGALIRSTCNQGVGRERQSQVARGEPSTDCGLGARWTPSGCFRTSSASMGSVPVAVSSSA